MLFEVSMMNLILRISKEIKCKKSVGTRNILDELHSSDIQGDQMEGENHVSQSIIDELHSSYIHGDEMEGESRVTRSIID